MNFRRYLLPAVTLSLVVALGFRDPAARIETQEGGRGPKYRFDASWPKPLPQAKDREGILRPQVTGGVGTHCIDSRDHIVQFNRRYVEAARSTPGGTASIAATPVFEIDP